MRQQHNSAAKYAGKSCLIVLFKRYMTLHMIALFHCYIHISVLLSERSSCSSAAAAAGTRPSVSSDPASIHSLRPVLNPIVRTSDRELRSDSGAPGSLTVTPRCVEIVSRAAHHLRAPFLPYRGQRGSVAGRFCLTLRLASLVCGLVRGTGLWSAADLLAIRSSIIPDTRSS